MFAKNRSCYKKIFYNLYHRHQNSTVLFDKSINGLNQNAIRTASFAKELTLGKLNMSWIYPYPTLPTDNDFNELNYLSEAVGKFFEDHVDSNLLDREGKMNDCVMQGLKDMGLFGMQIPSEYGGLGLNNVQYARVLEEISRDGSVGVMLAAHQAIGLKGILIAGNEEQKAKYLPKLASGELVAAFALTEPSSGSDAASIRTRARLSEDGKHWILNGEKIWITNGGFADVMTVFAKTTVANNDGSTTDKVTAFIVERKFGGVTSGKPEDKLGIRASNTCAVNFEDTPVPIQNVLGPVGGGFKLAMQILNGGRFSMGSSVAGQMKRVVSILSQHVHERQQFGRPLSDFQLVQKKIFEMCLDIYAMESMAYMTAGQMDQPAVDGTGPDCSIEAAMVKIYSSEAAWKHISESLQIFGGSGYMRDYPYERMLRDARILLIFEGTNEILRMFVSLSSLQFAGNDLKQRMRWLKKGSIRQRATALMDFLRDEIGRPRSGIFSVHNPGFEITEGRVTTKDWLHPSLLTCCATLEDAAHMYRIRVYQILKKYGQNVRDEQLELEVLADVATLLYAMTSVISRCNKSLFLSLRNSEYEKHLCQVFIRRSFRQVYLLLQRLTDRYRVEQTDLQKQLSAHLLEERSFPFVHPLQLPEDDLETNPDYQRHLDLVQKYRANDQ